MKALCSSKKEKAAQEIAEGRRGYGEIADKLGITVRALHKWRQEEKFDARVVTLREEFAERAKARAIRRKEYRIDVLADLQNRVLTVIEERAGDPDMAEVPGGKTGLLVRQYKVSGDTVVTEYAVDTGTIRELRAIQEQVSKELGQLVEKHDHRVIRDVSDLTDEELAVIANDVAGAGEGSGAEGNRAPAAGEGAGEAA